MRTGSVLVLLADLAFCLSARHGSGLVFEGFALFPGAGMELVAQFRLAQLCYVLLFMAVVGSGFLGSTPRQLVCDCGGGCCCNDCVNSGTTSKHTDTENPHRIETDKTICSKKELLIPPCCYWWRIWETL
jgi:hypothetical protein